MIYNSEKWKDYPKRKHGIVCSINESYFGNEYRIIPLKNYDKILKEYNIKNFSDPKWGICPSEDIWNSFKISLKEIGIDENETADDINYYISKICKHYGGKESASVLNVTTGFADQKNYDTFKKQLMSIDYKDIENFIQYEKDNWVTSSSWNSNLKYTKDDNLEAFKSYMKARNKNFYEVIEYIFSPSNDFQCVPYEAIADSMVLNFTDTSNPEIWTDTPVLYIREDDGD